MFVHKFNVVPTNLIGEPTMLQIFTGVINILIGNNDPLGKWGILKFLCPKEPINANFGHFAKLVIKVVSPFLDVHYQAPLGTYIKYLSSQTLGIHLEQKQNGYFLSITDFSACKVCSIEPF